MPHWTHRYAMPFFLSSLTAFLVVATALVVVLVQADADRDGADPGRTPDPAPSNPAGSSPRASPVQAGEIDSCVVGTWVAVAHVEEADIGVGAGRLELDGDGHVFQFRADGTGTADFGEGTRLVGEILEERVEALYTGQIEFQYTAADGQMQIQDQQSNAEFELDVELLEGLELPLGQQLTLEEAPFTYTCDGDSLAYQLEGRFTGEYARQSS